MSDDSQESIEREITGGAYGPGVFDEPSTYRPDKGADEEDLTSTLAAGTDTGRLQDGGPPPEDGGVMTTTGGTAGPNSFRPQARHGQGVAPTTTGDAGTGGMDTTERTYHSDNSTTAVD